MRSDERLYNMPHRSMSADDPGLAAPSGGLAVAMWRTTPAAVSTKGSPRMFRLMPPATNSASMAIMLLSRGPKNRRVGSPLEADDADHWGAPMSAEMLWHPTLLVIIL
jgi:hypothetical protein